MLALEDVDLGFHHRRPTGQRHELGVEGEEVLLRHADRRGHLLGGLDPFLLVPAGLGPGLGDEHLDLGQLAVEGLHLELQTGAEISDRLPGGVVGRIALA